MGAPATGCPSCPSPCPAMLCRHGEPGQQRVERCCGVDPMDCDGGLLPVGGGESALDKLGLSAWFLPAAKPLGANCRAGPYWPLPAEAMPHGALCACLARSASLLWPPLPLLSPSLPAAPLARWLPLHTTLAPTFASLRAAPRRALARTQGVCVRGECAVWLGHCGAGPVLVCLHHFLLRCGPSGGILRRQPRRRRVPCVRRVSCRARSSGVGQPALGAPLQCMQPCTRSQQSERALVLGHGGWQGSAGRRWPALEGICRCGAESSCSACCRLLRCKCGWLPPLSALHTCTGCDLRPQHTLDRGSL